MATSQRQRPVLGPVHGTITCGCLHIVDVLADTVQVPCSCTEERDVLGPLPVAWICPDCTSDRHELYGLRDTTPKARSRRGP